MKLKLTKEKMNALKVWAKKEGYEYVDLDYVCDNVEVDPLVEFKKAVIAEHESMEECAWEDVQAEAKSINEEVYEKLRSKDGYYDRKVYVKDYIKELGKWLVAVIDYKMEYELVPELREYIEDPYLSLHDRTGDIPRKFGREIIRAECKRIRKLRKAFAGAGSEMGAGKWRAMLREYLETVVELVAEAYEEKEEEMLEMACE